MLARLVEAPGRALVSLFSQPAPVEKESSVWPLIVDGSANASGVDQPKSFQDYQSLYESLTVVYRCVALNAQSVAQADLVLSRSTADGETDLPESHPVNVLLSSANPEMTTRDFIEMLTAHLELTGNAFIELVRSGKDGTGKVVELWPLNPSRVKVIAERERGVKGYWYEVNGRRKELQANNVLHVKYLDPNNDFYGISPLRAATRTLVADGKLEDTTNAMLRNGARLSGVVTLEATVTEHQIVAATNAWRANFSGSENAGKTAFIPGGREYKHIALTPQELEALATRRWNREQLLQALGVYPIIYGIMDQSATRENATVQRKLYYELTVVPKAERIAATFTERLLPLLGIKDKSLYFRADFGEAPFFRELRADEARGNAVLVGRPVLTVNEVREQLGVDAVEGGDELYDANAAFAAGVATPTVGGDAVAPEDEAEIAADGTLRTQDTALNGAQVTAASEIVQAVAFGSLPRDSAIGQLMVFFNLTREEAEAILGSVGNGFTPDVISPDSEAVPPEAAKSFRGTSKADGDEPIDPDDVASESVVSPDDPLLVEMQELFRDAAKRAGKTASRRFNLGTEWDADTPELRDWLSRKRIVFAREAHNRYAERVRETLLEGMEANETPQELADRVNEVFNGRKSNALSVARTEAASSANAGRVDMFREAEVERHRWVTQRDDEVREAHADIEGEVQTIGEEFSNGLEYPGDTDSGDPGEFVNCRCTTYPILPGIDDNKSMHDAEWKAFDSDVKRGENAIARQFVRIVEEQERRAIAALRRARA